MNGDIQAEFKRRLYCFVLKLIRFIGKLQINLANNVIGKQLLRSGTSILANWIEAKSASSRKDYINFFNHALKSANESEVWLALLRDTLPAHKVEIKCFLQELDEIANIFASSIITLKRKK